MKLIRFEISDFQCVRASNSIRTGDVTCLLGKNEAGKTALLRALYKLNPVIESDSAYDVVDDFPRSGVERYEYELSRGERQPATVARAEFELEDDERGAIEQDFGPDVLKNTVLTVSKGYDNVRSFFLDVDPDAAYKHFVRNLELPTEISEGIYECFDFGELARYLGRAASEAPVVRELVGNLEVIQQQGLDRYIYLNYLRPKLPQFVYFNDYYQLRGQENLQALKERLDADALRPPDYAMLGLMNLARLDVDQLLNPGRTQLLINKLEGAGNTISMQMARYWSQNPNLQVKFDVRPANPDDPSGEAGSMYIWTSVFDPAHSHSTLLSTRSRGFVWFFSFLAWYSQLKESDTPLILLLDEPGLSLHAQAQSDLLRFFEDTLSPSHQMIYTTHSPFMVDPEKPKRIRYVEDMSQADQDQDEGSRGTKVNEDAALVSYESVMPLDVIQRAAQAPEKPRVIKQLFVEDTADALYLRAMSRVQSSYGDTGLDEWTIIPAGGVENIPSLLGQEQETDEPRIIAVLSSIGVADKEIFEAFRAKQLLPDDQMQAMTAFSQTREAGIEDLFDIVFYINLVNAAYRNYLKQSVRVTDLRSDHLRLRDRVSDYLSGDDLLTEDIRFNHRRPARLFADNVEKLRPELTRSTRERFESIFDWLNTLEP